MSMTLGTKKGFRSEINITPYIDILLVLLIIFMVVTPVRQKELKVRVPQPSPPPPISKAEVRSDAIVVTVGERAQIDINRIPTDFKSLGAKLREIYDARRDKNMFINASPNLPYSDIVKVIDISKGAGVAEIGLLCQEIR